MGVVVETEFEFRASQSRSGAAFVAAVQSAYCPAVTFSVTLAFTLAAIHLDIQRPTEWPKVLRDYVHTALALTHTCGRPLPHRNHGGGAGALSPAFLILEGERRRPVWAGHAAVEPSAAQSEWWGVGVETALGLRKWPSSDFQK